VSQFNPENITVKCKLLTKFVSLKPVTTTASSSTPTNTIELSPSYAIPLVRTTAVRAEVGEFATLPVRLVFDVSSRYHPTTIH
jgi:hypothetical protein